MDGFLHPADNYWYPDDTESRSDYEREERIDTCFGCGEDVWAEYLDRLHRCEVCRAQPTRLDLDEP